jgi:FkbM family methyltransferase
VGRIDAASEGLASATRRLRRWWRRDHAWWGAAIRLARATVWLDGHLFDTSHPLISDAMRTRLWRGTYERSERALLQRWLDSNAPVVELGGGIGVVSTLVNCRLSNPARHVVVEANPGLLPILERQRQLNGASFNVEHAAIDYSGAATTTLNASDGFLAGRVRNGGPGIAVVTTTLGRVFERHPWTGVTLICDIEGLETDLVEHEGEILERHCRTLVIEVHPEFRTDEARARMFDALQRRGFSVVDNLRKVYVLVR